ncbi:hypothetical protein FrEUN1fDRAFT_4732 [Parafrankia sp. EUN1f]|nr:hypothetical protein FrEUN1fDRAFT_4732 [Parafrankia sp. EUN1f]
MVARIGHFSAFCDGLPGACGKRTIDFGRAVRVRPAVAISAVPARFLIVVGAGVRRTSLVTGILGRLPGSRLRAGAGWSCGFARSEDLGRSRDQNPQVLPGSRLRAGAGWSCGFARSEDLGRSRDQNPRALPGSSPGFARQWRSRPRPPTHLSVCRRILIGAVARLQRPKSSALRTHGPALPAPGQSAARWEPGDPGRRGPRDRVSVRHSGVLAGRVAREYSPRVPKGACGRLPCSICRWLPGGFREAG